MVGIKAQKCDAHYLLCDHTLCYWLCLHHLASLPLVTDLSVGLWNGKEGLVLTSFLGVPCSVPLIRGIRMLSYNIVVSILVYHQCTTVYAVVTVELVVKD